MFKNLLKLVLQNKYQWKFRIVVQLFSLKILIHKYIHIMKVQIKIDI